MSKLRPEEQIHGLRALTLGDFWSWAYSDILSNVNRSTFAEFMVAAALGVLDEPRLEWDAVDLRYQGHGIEVKAAAYLQTWKQDRLSSIRFDIAKKMGWDARTNTYLSEPTRSADCYVFCLYPETKPERAHVLDALAWEFYVLPAARINDELGDQKSIGINRVREMTTATSYPELRSRVDLALRESVVQTNED